MYRPHFVYSFIHLSLRWFNYWGCFRPSAIVNNAAMNTGVQIPVRFPAFYSFGCILGSGLVYPSDFLNQLALELPTGHPDHLRALFPGRDRRGWERIEKRGMHSGDHELPWSHSSHRTTVTRTGVGQGCRWKCRVPQPTRS